MALVDSIRRVQRERQNVHSPTECSASIVNANGKQYLQLDTYGSLDRQEKGKVSQSIQLSEEAAAELIRLIREAFPNLHR